MFDFMRCRMLGIAGLGFASWLSLPSGRAEACGGTFCDIGPMADPVDQAAETVLFVRDGAYVEAHIQIAIDPNTDAQKFAWVVPMPAMPEFSVGSQPLFDALLAASSPSLSIGGAYCGEWSDDSGGGFISSPDGGSPSGDPELTTQVVGAFEVTVISGGTVDAVMTWLGDNGYAQDPAAEPILAEYLADGHVLVAFKLIPSADSADVHPVVLRYQGDSPCVPLKLTAIAATENMGVRALFLGDMRWVPTNYRHVVPNQLVLPWEGGSYDDAITLAVDEAPAGHGFVTEYAGSAQDVVRDGIYSDAWDAAPFADVAAVDVMTLLDSQGFSSCNGDGPCLVFHPLVVAMLRSYLPAPPDVPENSYYGCLSCYADVADYSHWDAAAFAAELDTRVIQPGVHADALLDAWPYLTRLYTTISPAEMTVDPEFHTNADLPQQPALGGATRVCVECSDAPEDGIVTLPDGSNVYEPSTQWPSFPGMPHAERIEAIGPAGAPVVEIDNRADIHAQLQAHNATAECLPPGTDDSGGGGTGGGGSGPSATTGTGSSGGIVDDGESSNDAGADSPSGGCGCTGGPAGAPALLVLAAARLRRRRGR